MNNPASQNVTPPVLVLVQSPKWRSQIQRWLDRLDSTTPVHWLLNSEEAGKLILQHHNAAFVMELPANFSSSPAARIGEVTRLCNNPQRCPLFLLGDHAIDQWSCLLKEAGATDVCSSILDFEKFSSRIELHLKNSVRDDLTVEQKVAARLPW